MTIDRKLAIVAHDGIEIHYHNDVEGMRQSFVVDGSPGEGNLRLEMVAELDGVEMGVSERGDFVYFDNAVEEVLRYSDLNVWDARGEPLAAWFEAIDEERFAIVVDDAGAEYPVFIDPLSAYWGVVGSQNYAQYGFSVAYGNFNGSVGDIVVGAPYYDDGQTDEGKVFVYYGDVTGTPTTPSWTGQCDDAGALFGSSVSSGDLTGDGHSDLIVGAPNYDGGLAGAVYVWFGANTTGLGANGKDGNRDWFRKASTGNRYGTRVAAGDFDGDGDQDLIIGAPGAGTGGTVYVHHGSSTGPSSSVSWSATCGTANAFFGFSVACAGNVNGDIYDYQDIIIGARDYTNGQSGEGAAFTWHGSSSGLAPNPGASGNWARRLEGNQASAQFGYSVAGGDIDGDTYSDVIIGAPLYYSGRSNEGMVFAYYGETNGIPASAGWSAQSDQANAQFGFSVAVFDLVHATDADEILDGYAEVIVGAPYFDYTGADNGGAFVWQ